MEEAAGPGSRRSQPGSGYFLPFPFPHRRVAMATPSAERLRSRLCFPLRGDFWLGFFFSSPSSHLDFLLEPHPRGTLSQW